MNNLEECFYHVLNQEKIKKNVRDLVVGNNEYTRDEGFLEGLWRKTIFD